MSVMYIGSGTNAARRSLLRMIDFTWKELDGPISVWNSVYMREMLPFFHEMDFSL